MRIHVYAICKNEARIIPFFLRHYSTFAERIVVYDDRSTDGSAELLKDGGAEVRTPNYTGLNDEAALHLAMNTIKECRGTADWAMWVDMDEFIYSPSMEEALTGCRQDIARSKGYGMVTQEFPEDDGSQIWEKVTDGFREPEWGKPVTFRPWTNIRWVRGRHSIEGCRASISPDPLIKLLHYRWLGKDYVSERNAKNYENVGTDKGAAWACAPGFNGDGSMEWVTVDERKIINVLEDPL